MMMDLAMISEQLDTFKQADLERQKLTQNLLDRVRQLEAELKERRSDLDNEKRSRRSYQERADNVSKAIARHQFVHVLIDGDGYVFNEKYLRDSDSGGIEAAHALRSAIKDYIQDTKQEAPAEYEIMVTVLANKKGLAKAIDDSQNFTKVIDLDAFFCKFSQSYPLFQFVDCGAGKERVDSKLRAIYRHFVYNTQCLRVFLACCHDNGYVAELAQYQRDTVAQARTTLIEHAQQGRQYAGLPFESTSLGRLFMRDSLSPNVPKRPVPKPWKSSDSDNEDAMQTFSYSQAAKDFGMVVLDRTKLSGSSPMQNTATPSLNGSNGEGVSLKKENIDNVAIKSTDVPVNRYGERVDRKLAPLSGAERARFENRILRKKLCNEHHLRHACNHTMHCDYDHSEIDDGLKLALMHTARKHPCSRGKHCRRSNCYMGHHCPFDKTCNAFKCKFAHYGMHDIDMTVEKLVPAVEETY